MIKKFSIFVFAFTIGLYACGDDSSSGSNVSGGSQAADNSSTSGNSTGAGDQSTTGPAAEEKQIVVCSSDVISDQFAQSYCSDAGLACPSRCDAKAGESCSAGYEAYLKCINDNQCQDQECSASKCGKEACAISVGKGIGATCDSAAAVVCSQEETQTIRSCRSNCAYEGVADKKGCTLGTACLDKATCDAKCPGLGGECLETQNAESPYFCSKKCDSDAACK